MCHRCRDLDLRALLLQEVEPLIHDLTVCARLRRAAEREYHERSRGLDLSDPSDEKL